MVFADVPDVNTVLVDGSVSVSPVSGGVVTSGNGVGDAVVGVDLSSLAVGESVTITFDVVVDDPVAAGVSEVVNQGVVSSAELPDVVTDDPTPPGGADPTVTPIVAAPVVSLTKDDGLVVATTPGATVTYTLVATNSGDTAATGVVISDEAPAGTTFVEGSATASAGSIDQGDDLGETTVVVDVASLAVGASVTVTFQVTVDDPVDAGREEVSNTATIDSVETPPVVSEDLIDGGATITPLDADFDLTVTKLDDVAVSAGVGDTIVYTITAANIGDQSVASYVLTDTVPVGTTFVAADSAAGWSCLDGDPAGTVCTFNGGALAGGASIDTAFAVAVIAPAASGLDEIDNTVTIATPGELNTTNNADDETTPLAAAPQLTITKTDGAASTVPGATDVYTIEITNSGDQTATGVEVTETVPDETVFVAASSTVGWSCADGAPAGTTCTFTIPTLAAAGGVVSIDFAVLVDDPVAAGVDDIVNTARDHRRGRRQRWHPAPAGHRHQHLERRTAVDDHQDRLRRDRRARCTGHLLGGMGQHRQPDSIRCRGHRNGAGRLGVRRCRIRPTMVMHRRRPRRHDLHDHHPGVGRRRRYGERRLRRARRRPGRSRRR